MKCSPSNERLSRKNQAAIIGENQTNIDQNKFHFLFQNLTILISFNYHFYKKDVPDVRTLVKLNLRITFKK
jgi:hypothetical protein